MSPGARDLGAPNSCIDLSVLACNQPPEPVQRMIRRAIPAVTSLAFPIAWYGSVLIMLWASFSASGSTVGSADGFLADREHGAAAGDLIFFALFLWLIHLTTVQLAFPRWRLLRPQDLIAASFGTGLVVFGVLRLAGSRFLFPDPFSLQGLICVVATMTVFEEARRLRKGPVLESPRA